MNIENCVVAVGTFDGFNYLHANMINNLLRLAKDSGKNPVVVCLDDVSKPFLTSPEEKDLYIKSFGVENVFHADVKTYKDNLPDGASVLRESEICENLGKIRKQLFELIRQGDVESYFKIAKFNYIIYGQVIHGNGQGHKVGMPTANLDIHSNKCLPKDGVYASVVDVQNSHKMGATNIGPKPSVGEETVITIETNILDFDEDIYDEYICLELVNRIRSVKKFDNLEAVKQQVDIDKQQIISVLSGS